MTLFFGGSEALLATSEFTDDISGLDYNNPSKWNSSKNADEPLGSLGDSIWHDINRNGMRNLGELGIPNVLVTLLREGDGISRTTRTDINGYYIFGELPLGDYTLIVDTATLPDDKLTTPTADPDGNSDSIAQIELTTDIPINYAQDFGYERDPTLATLGQWFWIDDNKNGIREPNEPPVADGVVNLYDGKGNFVTTKRTSVFGYFTFLVPPGDYMLEFIKPPGYDFTIEGVNAEENSAVNRTTGFTPLIHVEAGEFAPNWNAGIIQMPSAINLSHFMVDLRKPNELRIQWTTSAEIDTSGFHILQSSDGTVESARRMTDRLIHSQGSDGAPYEAILPYNETVDPPLGLLGFWLYEVENSGGVNYYGPVVIDVVTSQSEEMLYLPFLLR